MRTLCHVVVILVVSMRLYPTATAAERLILIFSLQTENIFLVMKVCGSGGHCNVFCSKFSDFPISLTAQSLSLEKPLNYCFNNINILQSNCPPRPDQHYIFCPQSCQIKKKEIKGILITALNTIAHTLIQSVLLPTSSCC